LFDARRLSGPLAQVVKARSSHLAAADHFDAVDARRVDRKDTLDTDSVADLADGEGGPRPGGGAVDPPTFKGRRGPLVALFDKHPYPHRIAYPELRQGILA